MSATFQELGRRADEANKAVNEVYRYLETEGNNGKSVADLVVIHLSLTGSTRTAQTPAVQGFMRRLGEAVKAAAPDINGLAEQVMSEMRAEAVGQLALIRAEMEAHINGEVPSSAETEEPAPGKPYSPPRGRGTRGAQANG